MDCVAADAVDWLAARPESARLLAAIGTGLTDDVLARLDSNGETTQHTQETRRPEGAAASPVEDGGGSADTAERVSSAGLREIIVRRRHHFWCDLLLAFATALESADARLDRVPDSVSSALLGDRDTADAQPLSSVLADAAVRSVVHLAWRLLGRLLDPVQADGLPLVLRVLAALICPTPEEHPGLVRGCLGPLADEVVGQETRERLLASFPAERFASFLAA
ncbi:hypothetical protein [Allonocardiopsis opalescens]|uniref:Uncharacterized protein n=1 Tax=Allonocardiopsis opalescens TaxID=1144618 RepID=A0A2T0PX48_9ACTN|nr:hypothetical protein [Allonocardiopsis opalescens]PRX96101.1 hypothetical protein CLV72_108107 [Allonocardiopsis opalescens]